MRMQNLIFFYHGNLLLIKLLLAKEARLAKPGEFTHHAFINKFIKPSQKIFTFYRFIRY